MRRSAGERGRDHAAQESGDESTPRRRAETNLRAANAAKRESRRQDTPKTAPSSIESYRREF